MDEHSNDPSTLPVTVDTSGPLPFAPISMECIPAAKRQQYARLMDSSYQLRSLSYDDLASVAFYTTGAGAEQVKAAGRLALPVLEAGDTPTKLAKREAEHAEWQTKIYNDAHKAWLANQARIRKEAEERDMEKVRSRWHGNR